MTDYVHKINNQPPITEATVRLSDVWISLGVCWCVQILGVLVFLPLVKKLDPSLPWVTISFLVTILAFVIPLIHLASRYGGIRGSDLILRGQDLIVLFVSGLVLFLYTSLFVLRFGVRVPQSSAQMISALTTPERFLVIFIILVLVPFLEEAFFRRYVLELLRKKYSLPTAIFLTVGSEVFLHVGYSIDQLFSILMLSLGLTGVYLKSRLISAVIVHCLVNALFGVP
jgi:membrane protease YdiL (CAAX protease family)